MSSSIRAQVQIDLDQIAQLRVQYRDQLALSNSNDVPHETAVVLASVMHSFYNGAENAIKRILLGTDGSIPTGQSWHSDLLIQAANAQGYRSI